MSLKQNNIPLYAGVAVPAVRGISEAIVSPMDAAIKYSNPIASNYTVSGVPGSVAVSSVGERTLPAQSQVFMLRNLDRPIVPPIKVENVPTIAIGSAVSPKISAVPKNVNR